MALFSNEQPPNLNIVDVGQILDRICVIVIFIAFLALCLVLYRLIGSFSRSTVRTDKPVALGKRQILGCAVSLLVFLSVSYLIHMLPYLFFNKQSWHFIFVWNPVTIEAAVYFVYVCLALFYINISLKFVKNNG